MEPITMALIGGGIGGLLNLLGKGQEQAQAEELDVKRKDIAQRREKGIIGTAFSNALSRMGGSQGIELSPIRYEPGVIPQPNVLDFLKGAAGGAGAGLLAGQAMGKKGMWGLDNVLGVNSPDMDAKQYADILARMS